MLWLAFTRWLLRRVQFRFALPDRVQRPVFQLDRDRPVKSQEVATETPAASVSLMATAPTVPGRSPSWPGSADRSRPPLDTRSLFLAAPSQRESPRHRQLPEAQARGDVAK
jgi:hypothetical protein